MKNNINYWVRKLCARFWTSEVMQKPKYCKVTYSKLLKIVLKLKQQCTVYHVVYLGESYSSTQFSSSALHYVVPT